MRARRSALTRGVRDSGVESVTGVHSHWPAGNTKPYFGGWGEHGTPIVSLPQPAEPRPPLVGRIPQPHGTPPAHSAPRAPADAVCPQRRHSRCCDADLRRRDPLLRRYLLLRRRRLPLLPRSGQARAAPQTRSRPCARAGADAPLAPAAAATALRRIAIRASLAGAHLGSRVADSRPSRPGGPLHLAYIAPRSRATTARTARSGSSRSQTILLPHPTTKLTPAAGFERSCAL